MNNKYGFVYITTNKVNGKKYIGQKKIDNSNKWKSYLGSGTQLLEAIKIYGKSNFEREILEYADNRDELNNLEYSYIEKYNAVKSKDYYNLIDGGSVIDELKRKNSIPVINVDTGYIFKSIKDASRWSGVSENMIVKSFEYKHSMTRKVDDLIFKKLEVLYSTNNKICRCCCETFNGKFGGEYCIECLRDENFNSRKFKKIKLKNNELCYSVNDFWVWEWLTYQDCEDCEYCKYYPLTKPLNSKNK